MATPNPIDERLSLDSEIPDGTQVAFHAVVHLLVPCVDRAGNPIRDIIDASDYIAETIRDEFLDWGYVMGIDQETGEASTNPDDRQSPIEIIVSRPYVEGTFISTDNDEDESDEPSATR